MIKTLQVLVVPVLVASVSACTTLKTPTFADDAGAIRGYDSVAYHTQQMPVKGSSEHSFIYNDAEWYFSSSENLDLFRRNPDRYAPQYGGYCAYAMSNGWVVSTDPDAWHIEDEKLYLNYSLGVRKTWLKDIPGYIAEADVNWEEKISKPEFE